MAEEKADADSKVLPTWIGDPSVKLSQLRKWLFSCTVFLITSKYGWLDFEAIAETLQMSGLPIQNARATLTWAGVVLVIQGAAFSYLTAVLGDNLTFTGNLAPWNRVKDLRRRLEKLISTLPELIERAAAQAQVDPKANSILEKLEQDRLAMEQGLKENDELTRSLATHRTVGQITEAMLLSFRSLPTITLMVALITAGEWSSPLPHASQMNELAAIDKTSQLD